MGKRYTIYAHVNLINGKIYVGQTCKKSLKDRWREGKGYIGCKKFENAIKKYGWDNFEHIILAENLTYEECDYWENKLTKDWDTVNHGYNMRHGGITTPKGSPGQKHTDEWKQAMSAKWTGDGNPMRNRNNYGENNHFFGRTHTKELREKMSLERKGKPSPNLGKKFPEEFRMKLSRPVLQMSEDGEVVNEYFGLSKASEATGIMGTHIMECCKGRRRRAGGYKWAYKYPKDGEVEIFVNKKKRKVVQLNEDGSIFKTYNSVNEAAKANGVCYSAISNCCRGATNTSNGYVFKYLENGGGIDGKEASI